jgi:hypothetical protein
LRCAAFALLLLSASLCIVLACAGKRGGAGRLSQLARA